MDISLVRLQSVFGCSDDKRGDFPKSERWTEEILSLPVFVGLREEEIEYLSDAIKAFFQ
jgi:dTDP-4-amino-4,6-dideoxygalactose transaminase